MTVAKTLLPSQESITSFKSALCHSGDGEVLVLPSGPPESESCAGSTQVKCAELFSRLSLSGVSEAWADFYVSVFACAERQYGNGRDAWPAVAASTASGESKTCCYRWARDSQQTGAAVRSSFVEPLILRSEDWRPIDWSAVKGVFFWLHGLTDHARIELLAFDPQSPDAMSQPPPPLKAHCIHNYMLKCTLVYTNTASKSDNHINTHKDIEATFTQSTRAVCWKVCRKRD